MRDRIFPRQTTGTYASRAMSPCPPTRRRQTQLVGDVIRRGSRAGHFHRRQQKLEVLLCLVRIVSGWDQARIRTFGGKTDDIDCLGVLAKRRQVLHAPLLAIRINPPELANSQHGTSLRGKSLHTLTLLSPPAVASLLPLGSKWAEYIGALESCQLTIRGALFMV